MRIPVTQLPPKSSAFLPHKKKPYKLRVGINFHGATAVIYIYSTQIQCFQHPLHFRIPSLISDISGCCFFSFPGKWNRRLAGGLNKPLSFYSSESTNLKPTIFYGTPRHWWHNMKCIFYGGIFHARIQIFVENKLDLFLLIEFQMSSIEF